MIRQVNRDSLLQNSLHNMKIKTVAEITVTVL